MRKTFLLITSVLLSSSNFAQPDHPSLSRSGQSHTSLRGNPSTSLRGAGMSFTQNKGQIIDTKRNPRPDILYKGSGGGADVYLRKTGMSYVLSNVGEIMLKVKEQIEEKKRAGELKTIEEPKLKDELLQKQTLKLYRVDVDFVNGNSNAINLTNDEIEGYTNYFLTQCPDGITHVTSYNEVTVKNIYNNIDVKYYGGKDKGLKYDIIVNPGGNPNNIQLKYSGADEIIIKNEKLIIKNSIREITEQLPKVYQNINGKITDVRARYILNGTTLNFELGTWDHSFPLVVDPWATYYGGDQADYSRAITTDNSGNVVITGNTLGGSFPASNGGLTNVTWQSGFAGGGGWGDAFVVKFDMNGNRLWATYYGGNKDDLSYGVAADNLGNVIIAGYSYGGSFPISNAGPPNVTWQSGFAGTGISSDAFVVKFNANGSVLWATYYGGDDWDEAFGVATDNAGNVLITGETFGGTFPATNAAGLNVTWQSGYGGVDDALVVKFDPNGNRLWATYYGGDQFDSSNGIATDNSGNVLITGLTNGGTFPASNGGGANISWQSGFGGLRDAFVVKFDPNGNRLWATYYGGDQIDEAKGIATDNSGNVIITGYTYGGTFSVNNAGGANISWQTGFGGGNHDAFVVKFNANGSRLWATYYGSNQDEWGWYVATDANSNVYLLMEAEDKATPSLVDACTWQPVFNGGGSTTTHPEDLLIVKFSPVGQKICATYLGGTGEDDLDRGGGITIYGNSIYITGSTDGNYPVTAGAFQTTYAGPFGSSISFGNGGDVFVAQLCTNICEGKTLGLNYNANTTNSNCVPIKFTPGISNSCDTTGYKFHWTFAGGTPAVSDSVNPTVRYITPGIYDVKLVLTTICKKDSLTKTSYITATGCGCTLTGQFTKGTANCAGCGCKEWVMVTATGGASPYSYSWPDGYDKRYKNQLCPGAYTINIKDKNGCSVNVNLNAP